MTIDDWRRRIDQIDAQLVRLLNRRSACAREIGKLKQQLNLDIFSPNREAEILGQVLKWNQGPLDDAALRRLFTAIFEESRRLEARGADSEPVDDEAVR